MYKYDVITRYGEANLKTTIDNYAKQGYRIVGLTGIASFSMGLCFHIVVEKEVHDKTN